MTINPNIDQLVFKLNLVADVLLILSLLVYLFVIKYKSIVTACINVVILAGALIVRIWNIILQQAIH
jgi:hypothetical protein